MGPRTAVGIDIGGTNVRAALVGRGGKVIERAREESGSDPVEVAKRLAASLRRDDTVGVGIGVAGVVDRQGGRVAFSPNLQGIEGRDLTEVGHGLPVVVANDAHAATLGEKWAGAGRKFKNFVLLTLGTGIGCGVVLDGRLIDAPLEAGHMSIVAQGEKCSCGNLGCLEQYAAARAITDGAARALEGGAESMLRQCCRGNFYRVTPEEVFRIALEGDAVAREVLKTAGRYLGIGIANLVKLFAPEVVVVTGGLTGAWDIYVVEAAREAERRAFRGLADRVTVVPSALGREDAGVVGAAGLVLHGN
jgi:glucokinase